MWAWAVAIRWPALTFGATLGNCVAGAQAGTTCDDSFVNNELRRGQALGGW